DRISPGIVILRLEALNQRLVVGEIYRLIHVVDVWHCWNEEIRGIIGASEFQPVLSDEKHQLPVQDATAAFESHRNAGGFELVQDRLIARIGWVRARVDQDSNWNSRLPASDDLVGDRRVLHEPIGDIDPYSLVIDQSPERIAAVFKGGITETLLRLCTGGNSGDKR